jgi:ADP-ribose pyrophosphatase
MKEQLIFHGPIFDLIGTEVEINGKLHHRDIIKHNGGVSLLCLKDDHILLVKQPRAAVGEDTLEIPAGKLEKGEDPITCGRRELNEETGFECDELRLIQLFYPTPGYTSEKLYIYQCENLRPAAQKLPGDEDESIEIIWMPLDEAYEKALKSEIKDAKTILAIYHAMLERKS